ncbi:CGNR zinc finger domain-containing protein [Dongia soli]|uniref:CGNR zinc finger domain-containing protein n=1 Tax=Dongia soli TaxID=600628 RepID=A0ABU5E7I4_9PROT|nr:ABATE domain-containing protein [Dongia soli]MDY0882146.1 CGNR zinc finger domain-containing protein [Dongia soli]
MSGDSQNAASLVPVPNHEFCGGRLAVDFCNTLSLLRPAPRDDRLRDLASFVAWAKRAGWEIAGADAGDLTGFRSLRERLRNLFTAAIDGSPMAAADIDALDGAMTDALSALRLIPGTDRPLSWRDAARPVDRLRHAIARDAVDLLTAAEPARLKRCPGEDCSWLFYDSSKNGTRRWCAMEDCGTRDKVRRFREKQAAPTK